MEQMFNDLLQFDVPVGVLIGLLFFSVFISFFHFVIFTGIYSIPLKKYFFALYPCLVLIGYFIHKPYAVVVTVAMFVATFPLAAVGIILVAPFVKAKQYRSVTENQQKFSKGYTSNTKAKGHWFLDGLKSLLVVLGFFLSFALLGFIGPIFGFVILALLKKYNSGASLMKMQKSLPTSKIRSVAMGLAEIQGKIIIDEPLISKIKKKRCAGYYYFIQEIDHDKDGDETLTTIHSEFLFNPFYLEDESGKIKVLPENLKLLHFEEYSYRAGGKKYNEYVLEEDGDDYLLIGKADSQNNEPVFTYDEHKKILSITPVTAVEKHDLAMYYFTKARPYIIVFLLWTAFILSSTIKLTPNGLSIKPHSYLSKNLSIFNKKSSEATDQQQQNTNETVYGIPVEQ